MLRYTPWSKYGVSRNRYYSKGFVKPKLSNGPTRYRRTQRSYKGVDKKFLENYTKLMESKFINTSVTETPVAGTSDLVLVNGVTQGDTEITRDGESILITSLQYNLDILADADMAIDIDVDLLLVLKRDVRGTVISMTNFLVADDITEMRQVQNSKNFKVLHRQKIHIPHPAVAGSSFRTVYRYYHKFKKPLKTKYLSSSALVAGIDRNAIYLIIMTNAGATFLPTINGQVRVVFKDI